MPLWVSVNGVQNGEGVEAEVLNRPVFDLAERTNYLYDQLRGITGRGLFDSLRIGDANLLREGELAPEVKDFVYFDPEQQVYVKAQSQVSALDEFIAGRQSYAVGLLVEKRTNGTGTVIIYGRVDLAVGSSAGWTMSDLLDDSEVFRSGPYYLSAITPGKMTQQPNGPAIYLGYFNEDPAQPGIGTFAILSPQYKDMLESHTHRSYRLYSQPAGTHYVSGDMPDDTHAVLGFQTLDADNVGDVIPRLVLKGAWLGSDGVTYTFWLSNSPSATEDRLTSTPPTDFSDAYLHWSSSDPLEGSGAVRVWSYDIEVSVGTKGVKASLQRDDIYDVDPAYVAGWDEIYTVTSDSADKRTWEIAVPEQTRGWLSRNYRQLLTAGDAVSGDYTLALMGGPLATDDARIRDTITVSSAKMYVVIYTGNPADGDTLTVGSAVYEFDSNGSTTVGNIAVQINSTDADQTYRNLLDTVLAQAVVGTDAAINTDDGHVVITVADGDTVTASGGYTNATVGLLSASAGTIGSGAGVLVYDQNHDVLVASTSFWSAMQYWDPIDLKNGLMLMAIPYQADGTAVTDNTVATGDSWLVEIVDEAPGAVFEYNMPMHSVLNYFYPPIPFHAASLVLNGVELDSYHHFPEDPTYRLGNLTLYWYHNTYGAVPWPLDWESTAVSGDDVYTQNMVFHFVRHGLGTSVVTSLRPREDSPVSITQVGTNTPATVGDLEVDVNISLAEEAADLTGYNVFKQVIGNRVRSGPVVERIVSDGTINVSSLQGAPGGQGIVQLSSGSTQLSGEFSEVALENAKQEMVDMFPYIRLLPWTTGGSNIDSGFVAKFRVPYQVGTGQYKALVYLTVFGEDSIPQTDGQLQYAGLEFSYSILPDYLLPPGLDPFNRGGDRDEEDAWSVLDQSLEDGIIRTENPINVAVPFGYVDPAATGIPLYSAYDPMLVHNDIDLADRPRRSAMRLGNAIPNLDDIEDWPSPATDPTLRAGSIVAIRVKRSDLLSGGNEYTGALGFIGMRWRLQPVSL